jgi:hypothetical protein
LHCVPRRLAAEFATGEMKDFGKWKAHLLPFAKEASDGRTRPDCVEKPGVSTTIAGFR